MTRKKLKTTNQTASKKNVGVALIMCNADAAELTPQMLAKAMKKLRWNGNEKTEKTVTELTKDKSLKRLSTENSTVKSFHKFARKHEVYYCVLENGEEYQAYFEAKSKANIVKAFKDYIAYTEEGGHKKPLFGQGSQIEWAKKMADKHNNKNRGRR